MPSIFENNTELVNVAPVGHAQVYRAHLSSAESADRQPSQLVLMAQEIADLLEKRHAMASISSRDDWHGKIGRLLFDEFATAIDADDKRYELWAAREVLFPISALIRKVGAAKGSNVTGFRVVTPFERKVNKTKGNLLATTTVYDELTVQAVETGLRLSRGEKRQYRTRSESLGEYAVSGTGEFYKLSAAADAPQLIEAQELIDLAVAIEWVAHSPTGSSYELIRSQ
jgi:hypothetical protein